MLNDFCDKKRPYICQMPSLQTRQSPICPSGFTYYKDKCFFRGSKTVTYDEAEEECAYRGSFIFTPKERASYAFIQAFGKQEKIGDIFLGLNFTTNDTSAPVIY